MSKTDQMIDQIRRAVSARRADAATAELARTYADAVDAVNGRLRTAVSLLRRGLLSEAIHMVRMAPPALEEAARLDLPEREAWTDLAAAQLGLELPDLDIDAAQEVDDALPLYDELEPLLVRHRRLALGRAPLQLRVNALRKICQADPENPIWSQDLATMEKARHKQMRQELTEAARHKDEQALAALHQEFSRPWLEAPPTTLGQQIQQALREVVAEHARSQMQSLEPRIERALEERDDSQVQALLAEWAKLSQSAGSSRMPAAVQDARQWLADLRKAQEQEQAFVTAVGQLEHALDQQWEIEPLERAWAHLAGFDRTVPAVLKSRYEACLAEHQRDVHRRHRLKLLGVGGSLMLVLCLVGYVIVQVQQQWQVSQWTRQVEQAVVAEQWGEAQRVLEMLRDQSPTIWHEPEVQNYVGRVAGELEKEQLRIERLESALAQVRTAGFESPDRTALKRAQDLAQTDQEKRQVERLADAIRKREVERQREQNARFADVVAKLQERFDQFLTPGDRTLEQQRQDLEKLYEIESQINDLAIAQAAPGNQQLARTLRASVNATISSRRDRLNREERLFESTSQLKQAWKLHGLAGFHQEAARFIERHSGQPLSHDLQEALQQRPAVEWHEAWEALRRRLSPLPRSTAGARSILPTANDYLQRFTGHPYEALVHNRIKYLASAQSQLADPLGPDSPLRTLMDSPLMTLDVFQEKAGRLFYTSPEVDPIEAMQSGQSLIKYFESPDAVLQEQFQERVVPTSTLDMETGVGDSPQAAFIPTAEAVAEEAGGWEFLFLRVLKRWLEHSGVTPILKAGVASRLLTLHTRHGWGQDARLDEWKQQLDRVDLGHNWIDPSDHRAKQESDRAEKAISAAPDLPEVLQSLAAKLYQMDHLPTYQQIGVLWRDDAGKPTLWLDRTPKEAHLLGVAQADPVRLIRMGQISEGAFEFIDDVDAWPNGSLVLIKETAKESD